MTYTLEMYNRQKPVKKSILRARQAMAFFESILAYCRKQKWNVKKTKDEINSVKYNRAPELTEAKRRVLKMI